MNMNVSKLRMTLCDVSNPQDVAASKPSETLTELFSAEINYALNTIPSATVSIPLGAKIITGDSLEFRANTDDWAKRIAKRNPVCVKLEVESIEGTEGPESGTYILFKGYIVGVNTGYGIKGGFIQLVLQHWLADLAIVPVLNRLSAPGTPIDISMEACYNPKSDVTTVSTTTPVGSEKSHWTPVYDMSKKIENGEDLFVAFKSVLMDAAKEATDLAEDNGGYVSQTLYKTVDNALKHVSSENLKLNSKFLNSIVRINSSGGQEVSTLGLNTAIGSAVLSMSRESFYSVTIFDKLLQALLPNFYMTLVPLVDKAVVIPAPALQMRVTKKPITPDNIVKLDVSFSTTGVLAGMVVIAQNPVTVGVGSLTTRTTEFCYPENGKRGAGVIKVCNLPSWLETYNGGNFITVSTPPAFRFADPNGVKTADDTVKIVKKATSDEDHLYQDLCQAFVHTAYNAEVTKRNTALLIANLDFTRTPGQVVKVQLPTNSLEDNSEKKYIYGVINSVGINISSNAIQTAYRLVSVRDEALQESLGTSDDALLYAESWSGEDASLAQKVD